MSASGFVLSGHHGTLRVVRGIMVHLPHGKEAVVIKGDE